MRRDVAGYLKRKGIEYRARGDELVACCPFCGDKEWKFAVNVITGAWQCAHANRCGRRGSFWTLQRDLGDDPDRGTVRYVQKTYRAPPKVALTAPTMQLLSWFAARKIARETVVRFGVQSYGSDIVFPYFRDGTLVNRKYRDPADKTNQRQEKDAAPVLFGRDLVPKDADMLLIVEGEPDAMAAWQYGLVAVSVPSGASDARWIEEEWPFLERFGRILLCYDGDPAGEKGTAAAAKRLGWRWDLARVELPRKDMNDCLIAGVPEDDVRGAIRDARPLAPPEVKRLADVSLDCEELEPGAPTGIPGLDEKLGGFRAGELTIHGGEGGSGKTTATCQIVGAVLAQGARACIASLEMPLRALVFIMLRQAGMGARDYFAAYGDALYFIDLVGRVDLPRLTELMRYVSDRFGVQSYVIDSLGLLRIGVEDYWLQQKEATADLLRFARDNEVHVHLVHHLRKPAKDAGVRVNHADLEGSSWIRNSADNVLLYRRVRPEQRKGAFGDTDEVIYLDKNRFRGEEGAVLLRYDKDMHTFRAVETPAVVAAISGNGKPKAEQRALL